MHSFFPVRNVFIAAAFALALPSCEALTGPTASSLKGTYVYTGQSIPFQSFKKIELTGTKFVTSSFFGEMVSDYEVEDHYLYVNSAGTKYRFAIVSSDTLRADAASPFAGTYVKATR
jgi:hypothetical protein